MTKSDDDDRTFRAKATLVFYQGAVGADHIGEPDAETGIDLIADVLHWAAHTGRDAEEILKTARGHFLFERREEEDADGHPRHSPE
jgi:hypothetical protein